MKAFTFLAPQDLREAVDLLHEHGAAAMPMAGGQSLLLGMKDRSVRPSYVVSLGAVPELRGFRYTAGGELEIGAACTYTTLCTAPFESWHAEIGAVAGNLADRPVRNMGTIGGALCQADPRFDMPALAVGFDASVRTISAFGTRTIAAADLFAPTGGTVLHPGDLLTTVTFGPDSAFTGAAFEKFRYRVFDAALVSVACAVRVAADGTVGAARLAYGAIAPAPVLATAAAGKLIGSAPSPSDVDEIAHDVVDEVLPDDSATRTPLRSYQRELVNTLTCRAINRALSRS